MAGPTMVTNAQALQLSPGTPLQKYEDLLRATAAIAGCRNIQTFRECFAHELRRYIAFDYVLVKMLDPESLAVQWSMFHAPGMDRELQLPDFAPDETPSGWVYENQEPLVFDDWQREKRFPRMREYLQQFDIRSSCVLPLTTMHRRLGVFA